MDPEEGISVPGEVDLTGFSEELMFVQMLHDKRELVTQGELEGRAVPAREERLRSVIVTGSLRTWAI